MRTFHTGGVAGSDITQGLPRIQEIFEARNPKGQAVITEIEGVVEDIKLAKIDNKKLLLKVLMKQDHTLLQVLQELL